MQAAVQHVTALAALALYRSAAGSVRTIVESALYYTYFRRHPVELATLARVPTFYLSKKELVDHHKQHTPDFMQLQAKLNLLIELDNWYARISAVTHGQIPGTWLDHAALKDVSYSKANLHSVIETHVAAGRLVHGLFLCTAGRELWAFFSSSSKKQILHGMSGAHRAVFKLDSA
jgi:hypothetical protein